MKVFISILFLFCISLTQAQITERITVAGEIIAPEKDDVDGINIVNKTTNEGVVTDKEGNFTIRVGISDRLEVTAIQFQKFSVIVDKGIVTAKQLHIFVNESVNQLEEVVVTPYDLSGNIRADIKRVKAGPKILPPVYSAALINEKDYVFSADEQSSLDNISVGGRRVAYELNFVNLFKELWKTTHIGQKKKGNKKSVDVLVRNIYDDRFFKENLALEIDQIDDFIYFAEANGLNESLLVVGKELDLIEFLLDQGKIYQQ